MQRSWGGGGRIVTLEVKKWLVEQQGPGKDFTHFLV